MSFPVLVRDSRLRGSLAFWGKAKQVRPENPNRISVKKPAVKT
ncbi:MAG: hypothetical protein OXJ52_05585 [Oligoflexia bacterium]|nr:hypothetical protein [Oligoflexia bacterium]